jgi:hypothetical protein
MNSGRMNRSQSGIDGGQKTAGGRRARGGPHDRDSIFGAAFRKRVCCLGVRVLIPLPRSPQAKAFCERVIGTIRRACADYVLFRDEDHAERVLTEYGELLRLPTASWSRMQAPGAIFCGGQSSLALVPAPRMGPAPGRVGAALTVRGQTGRTGLQPEGVLARRDGAHRACVIGRPAI